MAFAAPEFQHRSDAAEGALDQLVGGFEAGALQVRIHVPGILDGVGQIQARVVVVAADVAQRVFHPQAPPRLGHELADCFKHGVPRLPWPDSGFTPALVDSRSRRTHLGACSGLGVLCGAILAFSSDDPAVPIPCEGDPERTGPDDRPGAGDFQADEDASGGDHRSYDRPQAAAGADQQARRAAAPLKHVRALLRGDLRILAYHRVLEPVPPDFSFDLELVSAWAEHFREQMVLLRRRFHPMRFDEVLACMDAGRRVPRNAVLVSFDDGYDDNYRVAFPILRDLDMSAMFFVATGHIDNGMPYAYDWLVHMLCSTRADALELPRLQFACRCRRDLPARRAVAARVIDGLKALDQASPSPANRANWRTNGACPA